jgi:chaperonin GroES
MKEEDDNVMADTATQAKTNIRPLGDRVVVKAVERGEQTKSGIYLPDTAQEKPQEALVIAVGPGKLQDNGSRTPMDLKEGDKILFSKYAGTEVKQLDEEYLILRESDILAVITD